MEKALMWLHADTPLLVGKIDGINNVFQPTVALRDDAVVYINGLARLPGSVTDNGYTFNGQALLLNEVPVPGDVVAIWQPDGAGGTQMQFGGPAPSAGIAASDSPRIEGLNWTPQGATWQLPVGSAQIFGP